MGEVKDRRILFSELSAKIWELAKSIRRAEEDLNFQWIDAIEQRDLQEIKKHMKAVEEALHTLQEEVSRTEREHRER